MTDAAPRQVASAGLRVRRVTTVTAVVRGHTGGNRERCSTPQRSAVTRHATISRARGAGHVLGVIEFDVEVFIEPIRKSLAWGIAAVDVLMADRAHGNVRRRKLAEMTSSASFVTGKTRSRRVVRAAVAVVATEGRVLLT